MKKLSPNVVIFLIVTITFLTLVGTINDFNDGVSEVHGEWSSVIGEQVIDSAVVWEEQDITINGSLFIMPGGSLTIRSSVVRVLVDYNGENWIEVFSGGRLNIINSRIYGYHPYHPYRSFILVHNNASVLIDSSEVANMGYGYGGCLREGIYVNSSEVTIQGSYFHDVHVINLANVSMVDIARNTFACETMVILGSRVNIRENTFSGVDLYAFINDSLIAFNTFVSGTLIIDGNNDSFISNWMMDCHNVFSASNSLIVNDTFIYRDKSWLGINLRSMNTSFINNKVYSSYSVQLSDSHNITMIENIFAKSRTGLEIYWSSEITCKSNVFMNNDIGLIINNSSSRVHCYLNDFVGNGINAIDEGSNPFDNGSIGNYWDDYNGSDINNDGVGDSPYYLDNNSVDRYPLVNSINYEEDKPVINKAIRRPTDIVEGQRVIVMVNATDDSGILLVILSYYDGLAWFNITMHYNDETGFYEAEIPALPSGVNVSYRIYVCDIYLNWSVSRTYSYVVKEKFRINTGILMSFLAILALITTVSILALKQKKHY